MKSAAHDLIDIHTHVVPETFPAYMGRNMNVPWPSTAPAHACHRHVMVSGSVYRTVSHQCWDCNVRLQDMERQRVARQVLSPMPELLSYWFDADDGSAMSRYLNDVIATMVASNPRQFTGLAAVPLQDVDAAIRELDFAIHQLKLAGVEIGTNVNGVPIGDPRFEPFFAAAAEWGAAIFVHPIRPAGVERLVGPATLQPAVAFPGETGLAAASIISGGTLARHPTLRIAFSHGGGTFASLLPRFQFAWENFKDLREGIALEPRAAARSMYYDSLVYDATTIRHLMNVFGETQVMAGTDYPFAIMDTDPAGRIDTLDLNEATQDLLCSANARRWLALD
jgi:aminocarboxymuconate-semialdehyde decarboxylase